MNFWTALNIVTQGIGYRYGITNIVILTKIVNMVDPTISTFSEHICLVNLPKITFYISGNNQ